MSGARLFGQLIRVTVEKLCRQGILLAGLVLLCVLLPLLAGQGAEALFSAGVPFAPFTLAVTAPEGDEVPQALADYLGTMTDVRQYCQVEAMAGEDALEALEEGEVTAVLILPGDFVRAVQRGENPGVRLIVDGRRPLESQLVFWAGQSAADMLAAVQSGVYDVLDAWDALPAKGAPRAQVVMEINLRYVRWVLQRQDLFRQEALLPTGTLPIGLHYRLCLGAYLLLSAAPALCWNYQGCFPASRRRLRYVLRSPLYGYAASLAVSWGAMALASLAVLAPLGLSLRLLGTVLAWGFFLSAYAALWGLAARTAAGCGALSFLVSLASLAAAGGIVPPVLLPETVRQAGILSPVAWLRDGAAWALEDASAGGVLALVGVGTVLMALLAPAYCRRVDREERT